MALTNHTYQDTFDTRDISKKKALSWFQHSEPSLSQSTSIYDCFETPIQNFPSYHSKFSVQILKRWVEILEVCKGDISTIQTSFTEINEKKYIYYRIKKLESLYQFVENESVINHLQNNPAIIETLEGIASNILRYFHKDDDLTLDVFRDPDEPEPEYLVIKIIVSNELNDPFVMLRNFMEEWYYKNVDILRTNIIFDFGYR